MNLKKGLYKYPENAYSLKRNLLLKWMYENGYSKRYIARRLGMDKDEFLWRIDNWEPFEDWQIRRLVKIMSAKAAFYVIYFHTNKQRKEIYRKVFGEELKEEVEVNGTSQKIGGT